MKNNIKRFGEFINEGHRREGMFGSKIGENRDGLAIWEIGEGMGGTWSKVSYGGQSIDIEEDNMDYNQDGEFIGYDKIFTAAAELGAASDMVYSVEDDQVLHLRDFR